jgi:hypothetical protein
MANKSQHGNKEIRKAKQPKVKAPQAASSFIITPAKSSNGDKKS